MKRATSAVVSMLIILSLMLAACGSTQGTTNSNNESASTPAPASTANENSESQSKTGNFALDYVPTKKDGFVVGFSNGYFGNTWRSQYVEGVEAVGKKYKEAGILKDLIVQNTNGVPAQISAVESFINSGVDAIVLNPVSSSALAPVVAKAISKGILVVVSDNPAEYPDTINVTGDNDIFFRIQTKWLAEKIKEGNIVHITGVAGSSVDQIRQDVAKEVLEDYPGIKELASAPGGWDPTKAQQVMANFLSAYKDIDGVLMQDVMTQGVLQAYEADGREIPPMTGDYTFGFFRMWKEKYPDLETIGVPYAPGVGANSMEVTMHLLQGYKLKEGVLGPNPANPQIINTILSPVPYVVTKEAEPDAPWMQYEGAAQTKAISLDEALKIGEGQPDGAALDAYWTEEQVSELFEKP